MRPPARQRLNLTIRADCLVHRVLFDDLRAVGVEVECGGEVQKVYGKRVTLSAGAIASPAILLRSGIGPAEDLLALGIQLLVDLPVGRNLIDHTVSGIYLKPKEGVCDMATPVAQVMVRYTAPLSAEFNDMQLYMFSQLDVTQDPGSEELFGPVPMLFGVFAGLQRPHARGTVCLRSADPHEQPEIDLQYVSDPEDMRRMVEGVRLAWQVASSPEVQQHVEEVMLFDANWIDSDDALARYVAKTTNTMRHPVGTARLGPDRDLGAVTDQYCRVRGVDGLRVVDASVMPIILRANTNLTCIMIGERVAEWMRAGTSNALL